MLQLPPAVQVAPTQAVNVAFATPRRPPDWVTVTVYVLPSRLALPELKAKKYSGAGLRSTETGNVSVRDPADGVPDEEVVGIDPHVPVEGVV